MKITSLVAGFVGLAVAALALGSDSPKPGPDAAAIAAEIARLADANPVIRDSAANALRKSPETAVPALIKALEDPRNEVRERVAEVLRSLLDSNPALAPNYHDEKYWRQRIAKIKEGMTRLEAATILGKKTSEAQAGAWSGWSGYERYQLDDYWSVSICLVDDQGPACIASILPQLIPTARVVHASQPKNYSGTWTTWHVNGRRAYEIQFRDGKYDGTFTRFHDNGVKAYQQHYRNHVCHGRDTGWYRSGKKMYEGDYRDGKQAGTWKRWDSDGNARSEPAFPAPDPNAAPAK